ncbi:hypothetical protein PV08_05717 [Exophiala spinifera]|uniref:Clr5 domain-containing protein n=1 Tax=Exophiala spinifera TaxID=91928 RepID=A0A0D2B9M8_9EURO|nr:uncharacterized protein PV08_05717 [Exophiala spinifera]KIW15668.1 hypothetical protein PV08_05717 [Exophiala spinifera]
MSGAESQRENQFSYRLQLWNLRKNWTVPSRAPRRKEPQGEATDFSVAVRELQSGAIDRDTRRCEATAQAVNANVSPPLPGDTLIRTPSPRSRQRVPQAANPHGGNCSIETSARIIPALTYDLPTTPFEPTYRAETPSLPEHPPPGAVRTWLFDDDDRVQTCQARHTPRASNAPPVPKATADAARHSHPSLQRPRMTSLLQCSYPLAVLMSQRHLRRHSPPGGRLELTGTPDPDVLSKVVDLLGWLQLSPEVVEMGTSHFSYLPVRFTFAYGSRGWTELLVCLKFAHIALSDEDLMDYRWKDVFSWCVPNDSFSDFCFLECSLLVERSFCLWKFEDQARAYRDPSHASGDSILDSMTPTFSAITELPNTLPTTETLPLPENLPTAATMPMIVTLPTSEHRMLPEKSWELHKHEICQLYLTHTLDKVAQIMEERHGFRASIRGYRRRLAAWGSKQSDVEDFAGSIRLWKRPRRDR